MATLHAIGEAKIHTFLPGCREESRLEASGVLAHEGRLIIIFDNLSEIARVDASFAPGAMSEWLGEHHGEAGHEDITYDGNDAAVLCADRSGCGRQGHVSRRHRRI